MADVRVFVPATIGNIGPGFDVLGLALDSLGDEITLSLQPRESQILSVSGRDAALIPTDPKRNVIVTAALSFLRKKIPGESRGVFLSVERQLPVSGGLGSSAAAAVGGALAAAHACGESFTDQDILEAALAGETMVAGRHLDNIAPCYFGGMTLVQRVDPPLIQKFSVHSKFVVVVVTPRIQLSTQQARGVLPPSLSTSAWTQQMSFSVGLSIGLMTGQSQLVRDSLHDLFAEPVRQNLIPHFNDVKQAALNAGALGCSISGAGPSVFAIFDDEPRARAAADVMTRVFGGVGADACVTRVSQSGARRL